MNPEPVNPDPTPPRDEFCTVTKLERCYCSSGNEPEQDGHSSRFSTAARTGEAANGLCSVLFSFVVAFFPKCPMCWAFYMSLIGIGGLDSIPYTPWLKPLIAIALVVNLYVQSRFARRRQFWPPFYISCFGAGLVLACCFSAPTQLRLVGILIIIAGLVLNNVPLRLLHCSKKEKITILQSRNSMATS